MQESHLTDQRFYEIIIDYILLRLRVNEAWKYLRCCKQVFRDVFPKYCRRLQKLSLRATTDIHYVLQKCCNLKMLRLYGSSTTMFNPLKPYTSLTALECCTMKIEWFSVISRMFPCLTSLVVEHIETNETSTWLDLSILSQLPLQQLHFSFVMCRFSRFKFSNCMNSLQDLKLYSAILCDNHMDAFISCFPNLSKLNLSNCKYLTPIGLNEIRRLSKLQVLNLVGCEQLTDDVLYAMSELSELQCLDIQGCTKITDEGLRTITRNKNLVCLEFTRNDGISQRMYSRCKYYYCKGFGLKYKEVI